MHKNYMEWMKNTLSQEMEDWQRDEDPEKDTDDCFHTQAPLIIFQVIDQSKAILKRRVVT